MIYISLIRALALLPDLCSVLPTSIENRDSLADAHKDHVVD